MPASVFGSFEDTFEQGVSQGKQTAKQHVTTTAKTAVTQLGGSSQQVSDSTSSTPNENKSPSDPFNETATAQQQQPQQQDDSGTSQQSVKQLEAKEDQERQIKLAEARKKLQQLHNQVYYDPTFKKRPHEETTQERLEKEEQEKQQKQMEKLEEQKKKEPPIALRQAQTHTEINRGASG